VEKLEQASHKLAEVLYQDAQQQAAEGEPPPAGGDGDTGDDGPVDADFEVVDDDKK